MKGVIPGRGMEAPVAKAASWSRENEVNMYTFKDVYKRQFVSSSLLFCVGAMAIVGSLEDGLSHNYNTLFTKAVMDGVLSVVFTACLLYTSINGLRLIPGTDYTIDSNVQITLSKPVGVNTPVSFEV